MELILCKKYTIDNREGIYSSATLDGSYHCFFMLDTNDYEFISNNVVQNNLSRNLN